jgi:methyl-accepting chemotaxis protein
MSHLSLKQIFMLVAGVLAIGFLSFGLVSFIQFEQLSINGPTYKKIVDGKDLVADILPPPLYVIEANLIVHRLVVEQTSSEISAEKKRLSQLASEFEKREDYWKSSELAPALKTIVEHEIVPTGKEFFAQVNRELGAIDSEMRIEEKITHLKSIQVVYNLHRQAVDKLVNLTNEYNSHQEVLAKEQLDKSHKWLISIFIMSLAVSIFMALRASASIRAQLGSEPHSAQSFVEKIAQGDLTAQSQNQAPPKSLMAGIILMQGKIADIVSSINTISKEMTQSIFHIALTSKEIAQSTDTQAVETHAVDEATKDLRTILASVQMITEQARLKTHDVENRARASLNSLGDIITQMDTAVSSVTTSENSVKSLAAAGVEINSIVSSIKTISDQTNLLALNAAIEAARAGEQGRGFAVVADEVRTLAIKTGQATSIIQKIVDDLNEKIHSTLTAMTQVSEAVKQTQSKALHNGEVVERMAIEARESSEFSSQISAISEDQINRIGLLEQRLHRLFDAMKSNSSTLDLIASISDGLHRTVDTLQAKIQFFQFDPAIEKAIVKNDKRQHQRMRNSLFLTLYVKGEQVFARTRDFSLGGLSFVTKTPVTLQKDDHLEVLIHPPASNVEGFIDQEGVLVKGKLVRVLLEKNEHVYALEFDKLTAEANRSLQKIVAFYEH